ncbi:hypothetical protein HMPREF0322_00605 [Desulfitobacterium hafniense DP7]|uniref:Uncharacterized protein n=1 Tax=Desulfitobacterium hafniense DP7 TaxID=537010 RepID=G9XI30_DESHA|nr:hypothetical protein HMPREF0322_00605 [Desulfitobacterium hafniense DP7]
MIFMNLKNEHPDISIIAPKLNFRSRLLIIVHKHFISTAGFTAIAAVVTMKIGNLSLRIRIGGWVAVYF